VFLPLFLIALTACQAACSFSHYSTNSLHVILKAYLGQFCCDFLQPGVDFNGFHHSTCSHYAFDERCAGSFAIFVFMLK